MIYLGLGSNEGSRREHLARAIEQLKIHGFQITRTSPLVESPALLKPDAPSQWNQPYLNLVLEGDTSLTPAQLLKCVKKIEQTLGRDLKAPNWSPRPIDIDLLLWHQETINTPSLQIPHPQLYKRAFVITPLVHLAPNLILPGIDLTPLQISQQIRPIPLFMGIVNRTPDSFSDGGLAKNHRNLHAHLSQWVRSGVHILDIGAESTRPDAMPLSHQTEWRRLAPIFEVITQLQKEHVFMPLISIDTRHAQTAQKALHHGADWINDVTGFEGCAMRQVLQEHPHNSAVAMHSLSVPVDPRLTLDLTIPASEQIINWIRTNAKEWAAHGLKSDRIIIDPGVGFGKTSLQNIALIKACKPLRSEGFRLLIGHSRKSFMNPFCNKNFTDRDAETLGLSLAMCAQGVDILRVHNPIQHLRAYRAWSHAQ